MQNIENKDNLQNALAEMAILLLRFVGPKVVNTKGSPIFWNLC